MQYLILALCCALGHSADVVDPLVFGMMKGDAHKLKIFWNPLVNVKHVVQLANRDVRFMLDNSTNQLKEVKGEWRTMVNDNDGDDGSKRYVFLKTRLCDEQDWQVSWQDGTSVTHGPDVQRMLPSPIEWNPSDINISIDRKSLQYDSKTDMVMAKVDISLKKEAFSSQQKIGDIAGMVELNQCDVMFTKPQSDPVISGNKLTLPASYIRNGCSFYLRAQQLVLDSALECRQLYRTTDNSSLLFTISCNEVQGINCPSVSADPKSCDPDCRLPLHGTASWVFDNVYNVPEPRLKFEWNPATKGRPIMNYMLRYSQIDKTFMNYPIKEFNITDLNLKPEEPSVELDPFSRDPSASYGFKLCAIYEHCDAAKVDWSKVPLRQIYFNDLIDNLGAPPNPPPTTPTPSVPEPTHNVTVDSEGSKPIVEEPIAEPHHEHHESLPTRAPPAGVSPSIRDRADNSKSGKSAAKPEPEPPKKSASERTPLATSFILIYVFFVTCYYSYFV